MQGVKLTGSFSKEKIKFCIQIVQSINDPQLIIYTPVIIQLVAVPES